MELMAKATILKLVIEMKKNDSPIEEVQLDIISEMKTRQKMELLHLGNFIVKSFF